MTSLNLPEPQASHISVARGVIHHVKILYHSILTIVTNSAIISKGFAGRYGRGYLCHDVINVDLGRVQERNLLTGKTATDSTFLTKGLHTVRDLNCIVCKKSLGWKYCTAKETSQRYKMGKFLLEALHVVKLSHWPEPSGLITVTDDAKEKDGDREYHESRWETRSIDLATLPDEDSRPSTPMLGKKVQGNMFYEDIDDLMLGWADGGQRTRR
jgi:Yippee zinc-binding/DNA-binding /Mis18, centromere assembly